MTSITGVDNEVKNVRWKMGAAIVSLIALNACLSFFK